MSRASTRPFIFICLHHSDDANRMRQYHLKSKNKININTITEEVLSEVQNVLSGNLEENIKILGFVNFMLGGGGFLGEIPFGTCLICAA